MSPQGLGGRNIGGAAIVLKVYNHASSPRRRVARAYSAISIWSTQPSDRGCVCPQEPGRAFHRHHHVAARDLRVRRGAPEVVRDAGHLGDSVALLVTAVPDDEGRPASAWLDSGDPSTFGRTRSDQQYAGDGEDGAVLGLHRRRADAVFVPLMLRHRPASCSRSSTPRSGGEATFKQCSPSSCTPAAISRALRSSSPGRSTTPAADDERRPTSACCLPMLDEIVRSAGCSA